jgi:hypothetical protein
MMTRRRRRMMTTTTMMMMMMMMMTILGCAGPSSAPVAVPAPLVQQSAPTGSHPPANSSSNNSNAPDLEGEALFNRLKEAWRSAAKGVEPPANAVKVDDDAAAAAADDDDDYDDEDDGDPLSPPCCR